MKGAKSGNSEDSTSRICSRTGASQGFGATALGRRGLALAEVVRLGEELVWREGPRLLSDKLNPRHRGSSTWKCEWGTVG